MSTCMPILFQCIISKVKTWYQAELGTMMHFVITVHNVLRLILLSILVILTFLEFSASFESIEDSKTIRQLCCMVVMVCNREAVLWVRHADYRLQLSAPRLNLGTTPTMGHWFCSTIYIYCFQKYLYISLCNRIPLEWLLEVNLVFLNTDGLTWLWGNNDQTTLMKYVTANFYH